MPSLKVETPKNLDGIFSLDCFKFNEMNGIFHNIYQYLSIFGSTLELHQQRMDNIPDFSKLERRIKDTEKTIHDTNKKVSSNYDDLLEKIKAMDGRVETLETITIKELETSINAVLSDHTMEIDALKNRPVANGEGPAIDMSQFCTSDDYFNLLQRVEGTEKRNLEQDERLTNYEHRIAALEQMISEPMERILALEKRCDNLQQQLNNKVNIQDLYNELLKKADINDLKALEASLIRLNELINDLANQFADRVENDKAHKLLQKNLKNLYDLFMSLKGEGTEDDPMFTTKGINCASCAKGVQNMLGFRADHVNWGNFPFKDASQRMQRQGQGFSKQYGQSQYEASYYNGMNVARTSADGNFDMTSTEAQQYRPLKGGRGSSAQLVNKRTRPMTAKVRKQGI